MPIVVVMAGALAQAIEAAVAVLEKGGAASNRKSWRTALFWKLRAEIRRQLSKMMAATNCRSGSRRGGRGSRSTAAGRFGYDPFSYALNFDDGVATLFPTLLTIVTTAKPAMLPAAAEEEDKAEDDASFPREAQGI